jgi:hypothetical protein
MSEFRFCPEAHTHETVEREELPLVISRLEETRGDPVTVAELRHLIAGAGDERPLRRITDGLVIRYVVQLLTTGHLKAIMCGLRKGTPAVTISRKDTQFHIGTAVSDVTSCPSYRTHKLLVLDNPAEIKRFLENAAADSGRMNELRRFAFAQPEFHNMPATSPKSEVLAKLGALLASRRLCIIECGVPGGVGRMAGKGAGGVVEKEEKRPRPSKGTDGGPPDQRAPVTDQVKTWIEIRLVDQDGKPVSHQSYELKLPDGSMRKGTLDEDGRARYDGIDPGNCTVCFPDIDGREWKPA